MSGYNFGNPNGTDEYDVPTPRNCDMCGENFGHSESDEPEGWVVEKSTYEHPTLGTVTRRDEYCAECFAASEAEQ